MGRIEKAEERLDRALDRLEAAAAARAATSTPPSDIERELASARARCETLETRSREVSGRLDVAIARLQSILGGTNGAG